MSSVVKDISGKKFGMLTAVRFDHKEPQRRGTKHYWLFKCDCGKEIVAIKGNVVNGHTKSCGCFAIKRTVETNTKHGDSRNKLYFIWHGIRNRCLNKNVPEYERYGGRGISICKEWESYQTFKMWSITNGYKNGLSIDRIDNDGNYCPENCRWITRSDNSKRRWI